MSDVAQVVGSCLVVAGVLLAALALSVARRPRAVAGRPLAVLLLAAAWWGLAGAVELGRSDPGERVLWGDLKYVGIVLVPPALLVFALLFTGRRAWVRWWTLALLAVEPLLVLLALAVPATHSLFRYLPGDQVGAALPVVAVGPLFWVHAAYAYLLVVVATSVFLRALLRAGRVYRRLSVALAAAATLPWLANVLFNLGVGPFARVDLTPFLFVLSGAVLVRGLLHGRLMALAGTARDVVVDSLSDGVLVVDTFGRVVEANPAARRLLGAGDLVGVAIDGLLPGRSRGEVELCAGTGTTLVEVREQPLRDRSGREAGVLLLLRDITGRRAREAETAALLQERTRVAAALQTALSPSSLPAVPGLRAAALYRPAGTGHEIGGDFYELFPLGSGRWCAVLGDVAGKGAEAAAVTARVRFTVRALAAEGDGAVPLLTSVNAALLADFDDDERFCTLVHLVLQPHGQGVDVDVVLAGHPQPLLRRADGRVVPVGEPGTALGLTAEPTFAPLRVTLAPGDLLCLFTDGLLEARDPTGTELGAARVTDVLAGADPSGPTGPQDVVTALGAAARTWHGGDLADDLAVLVLLAGVPAARVAPAGRTAVADRPPAAGGRSAVAGSR